MNRLLSVCVLGYMERHQANIKSNIETLLFPESILTEQHHQIVDIPDQRV